MDDRTLRRLRAVFQHYADSAFPVAGADLYASITREIVDDDDVLGLCGETLPGQPAPNLLFGAVHQLLQAGAEHPLAAHYADLTATPRPNAGAGVHFRDFCMTHGEAIRDIVRTRRVQTNVLERCGVLLPAFAAAAEWHRTERLALIEIGASAGLNLLWDRYRYSYSDGTTWGDQASPVALAVEMRGASLPRLLAALHAAWSRGIDLEPVDLRNARDVAWQRALMWPERIDRQRRLEAAIGIASEAPPNVIAGDALQVLPLLIEEAPGELPLVMFASFSLYQFPAEARASLQELVESLARRRPIAFVIFDAVPGAPAEDATIVLQTHGRGSSSAVTLARAHPHGAWLEWL